MRAVALVATSLLACTPAPDARPAETGTRYITLGVDAVPTASALAARLGDVAPVIATVHTPDGDAAILAVDAADLEALSEAMHAAHDRCGGFMLHDSLADARAALAPPAAIAAPDYTLDRGDTVRALLPQLSAAAIHRTIGELSGMKNRYYRSESGAAASAWLRDRWRSFTDRADVTVELFDQGYPQKSVILTIPGSSRAEEVVVIGGHLDSIALGGMSATAPGADDDASGIATLTEVARVLLAADLRPERTLKFIAYAAEEVGLRGSLAVVKDFKARGIHVVGALQLDMTNYQGSDRDIWLINDYTSKPQNAFLVQLLETYIDATWGVDVCGYACSDHASWHQAGIPASMPFEARFRDANRHIHSTRDTLEQSGNNAAHAVKFASLATAYAIELAKAAPAPRSATAHTVATTAHPTMAAAPRVCHRRHRAHRSRDLAPIAAAVGLVLAALALWRAAAVASTASAPRDGQR